MAAAKHNIIVSRGEDFSFTLTVTDSSGGNVDLSNNTFTAEIRRDGGKPLVASFSFGAPFGADTHQITATLSQTETLKLDGNVNYKWDMFRTDDDAGTTTSRLIYGDVKVENNVTDI